MTKQEFLELLKGHNWSYHFGSTNTMARGERTEAQIKAAMANDPALQALYAAYKEFVFGRGEEPTAEETEAPATQSTPKYNRRAIMVEAWSIARKAAHRYGHNVKAYLPMALAQAWAKAKAKAMSTQQRASKAVYYICVDETLTHNRKLINQPAVDQVFTDREEAQAALAILSQAFTRPYIKTSTHYRLH